MPHPPPLPPSLRLGGKAPGPIARRARSAASALTVLAWSIPLASVIFGPLWSFVFALVKLGLAVLTIIAMAKAFSGVRWEIPFAGPIARRQVGE